jgi:hypothetical protein
MKRYLVLASMLLSACGPHTEPSASEMPGGPSAIRHVAVMPSSSTDVTARIRETTVGVPVESDMTADCVGSISERYQVIGYSVAEGGAVQFDAGLIVRAQMAPQSGVPIFVRAANGLAAYVCGQDIEPSDAPIPQ